MQYEMKDSRIEWLGAIPSHWEIKRGKNCLTLLSRSVLDDDDIITCFRDGEVTLRKNRREEGFTNALLEIGYQGVNAGDLVVHGMDGFAGAIGISDSRGKASPVLNVMDSPNCKRFLMYYLRSLANKEVFLSLSTGIRVRSCDLRWNKLAVLPFILPSLPEQTAIAAYLDEKCGTIDEIIAEAKASIEEYKAWKSSVIFEAVTKGLDPHAEMKDSGVEWIGKVPRHWKVCTLKRLCSQITDGSHFSPETVDDGFPYITAGDVSGKGLNYAATKKISTEDFENLQRAGCRPYKGDVLLVKDGATTGRTGLMIDDTPCVALSSVAILRPAATVNSAFLMYLMMSELLQFQIRMSMAGSAMPRTTLSKLVEYKALFCENEEQLDIVKYLDEKCAAIDGIIAEKEALIADMEAYKKSLIFETVTGKRKVC